MVNGDVIEIISRLKELAPEHDSPIGLIHPYWARKPLNIIQELVSSFSSEGDLVADPFVGSGTTVFAALVKGRKVVASDLNPLSIFITKSILDLNLSSDEKMVAINQFIKDLRDKILPWFKYEENWYVERERFQVEGNFDDGDYELVHTEVVLKALKSGKFYGRRVEKNTSNWMECEPPENLIKSPLDFSRMKLLPNSRIAIPNGANLTQFYDKKNQAAINLAIELINSGKYGIANNDVLKLLLSSSLPLLRLSDKKASSQWPYWRPKNNLTSRNPIIVLYKKVKAFETAISWLETNFCDDNNGKFNEYYQMFNKPVQSLLPDYVVPGSVDLIITDPPYSDQAPYLEYSSLWIQILGLSLPKDAYKFEIVKTDAPDRIADTCEYSNRLSDALKVCAEMIKPTGFVIWFYQDHIINHWAIISEEARKNNISIIDVIPMPKQRRSMKTITTPGRTLDGDLILIFRKERVEQESIDNIDQALDILKRTLTVRNGTTTYFERYAVIIEMGLKYNMMQLLAQSFSDIREVLRNLE